MGLALLLLATTARAEGNLNRTNTAVFSGARNIRFAVGQDHRQTPPPVAEIARADLYIRDPFIVPDPEAQTYYLYKSARVTLNDRQRRPGVVAYTSKDLQTWRGPYPVFHYPDDLWASGSIWAPEVHRYKGKYYLFATFNSDRPVPLPEGRPKSGLRATQICVAASPLGPFKIFENRPHTPQDWLSLIMPIHQPNSGPIRMRLFELEDLGDTLRIKGEITFSDDQEGREALERMKTQAEQRTD